MPAASVAPGRHQPQMVTPARLRGDFFPFQPSQGEGTCTLSTSRGSSSHPRCCDRHPPEQPTASTMPPGVPGGSTPRPTPPPGAGTGTDGAAVAGNETGWKGAGVLPPGREDSGGTGLCRAAPAPLPAGHTRLGVLVLAAGQAGDIESFSLGGRKGQELCAGHLVLRAGAAPLGAGLVAGGWQGLSPLQGSPGEPPRRGDIGHFLHVSPFWAASQGSLQLPQGQSITPPVGLHRTP